MEAIGRLAGGVAHDFNNLIAGIMGISSELKTNLTENPQLRNDVEDILKACQRAFTVTRQLLAFGRRQIIQGRVLNIDEIIREISRMLNRLIPEDIQLVLDLHNDGHIMIDSSHLEQIILNLVINARDAMPMGGHLTLHTEQIHVPNKKAPPTLPHGSYALLEIRDTGVGMSEETLTHIFEPFFTTKSKERGSGLGLSTVYGIVKQNRGEITVNSQVGAGSLFRVFIPTVAQAQTHLSKPHVQDHRGPVKKATLLVVEDEDIVRRVVVRELRRAGYNVLEASQGHEAIEVCNRESEPIDLLLTDVILTGMNGKEIAESVRKRYPRIQVLFMSGYPQDLISDKGILAEGVSFLDKTELHGSLLPRVHDLLTQAP
jgi:two-component system cell cycle sensor histidine kinase/response regulator CckA